MEEKKQSRKKFWAGLLVGVLLTGAVSSVCLIGVLYFDWGQEKNSETVLDDSHREKLEYIERLIDTYYLHDIDKEKLADGIYAGLVAGLEDPYSRYYTSEEYQSLTQETDGHYSGIGVVMQMGEDGLAHLVRIYEGAPGCKAGLQAGDIIYKVDGETVGGMELAEIAKKIKSPDSQTVDLTIVREGESDYLEFTITKEDVQLPMVAHEMLDHKIGYLALYEFTSVSFQQYQAAYEDLKSQGMERLIIDLRDNPGGLLTSVCDILNTILPQGTIVYTEDKNGNRQEQSCTGESPIDIPLVILVNENSASASEIFAGAVKDYGIGTIVGTTTFGKGVVQTVKEMPDGSAVKLTISNYYTPLGNNINGKGITPDVEVELDESITNRSEMTKEEDNQLQKAIETVLGEE